MFGKETEDRHSTDDFVQLADNEEENDESENETQDDIELENAIALLQVEDENQTYEFPKHWRCAAHAINPIASVDFKKAFSDHKYKKANRSAFAKAVALWNK